MDIELLRTSFALVANHAQQLADTFYDTLFERYPEAQPLFAEVDMKQQKGKLLAALSFVVANLERPVEMGKHLRELGRRHLDYGVVNEHYGWVGECLLAALENTAGDAWNEQLESAWSEAYGAVAGLMQEGVRSEAA